MKRSTKRNVGIWPNMRDDTLKAVAGELVRARKKHPAKMRNLEMLINYSGDLRAAFWDNDKAARENRRGIPAVQIYALAATVAAMAIRCMEEGAEDFSYAGNTVPELELTND